MAITKTRKKEKGILMIELLVVIAIIGIGLVSLLGAAAASLRTSILTKQNDQAKKLAEEALEVVRNFRDGTTWNANGLGTLTLDNAYHLEKTTDDPPKWNLVLGEETTGIFKRKVIFEKVLRDINDNIAPSGTEDLNTKKVTATISWDNDNKNVEISTYLTNWR